MTFRNSNQPALEPQTKPITTAEELRLAQVPPAFVESLSGIAWETLYAWLKANTPQTVSRLFFHYEGLTNYVHQIAINTPAEHLQNFGIAETVIQAIQEINDLGGVFCGANGEELRAADFKRQGGAL